MSNFEKVEQAYNLLKGPINTLLSQPDTTEENIIIKQNAKMLKYFTYLNKIVSLLSDAKIPPTRKKPNINSNYPISNVDNEKIEDIIEENNKKLLNNYQKDNNKCFD